MILEGALKEGDPLPSVRNVAAEFRLNPLTVLKGYQQLVDEQLVEKRRGRGMFVSDGARKALMKDEKARFLEEEWPKVYATIQRLGLSGAELLRQGAEPPAAPSPSQASPTSGQNDDDDNCSARPVEKLRQHAGPRPGEFFDRGRPDRRAHRSQRRRQDHRPEVHPRP